MKELNNFFFLDINEEKNDNNYINYFNKQN